LRIEAGGQFSSIDFPGGISSAGFIAFRGTLPSPSREGIFTGDGGAPITIATACTTAATPFSTFIAEGAPGPALSINAAGDAAFRAGLKSGMNDSGIFVGFGNNNTIPIPQRGDLA
jgi:hypothetical protein